MQLFSFLEELDETVLQTIRNAQASSTQASYSQKWSVFSDWCHNQQVDPFTCSVHLVLCFLQSLLDSGKASSTVRVYAVAISALHESVGGVSVGRHPLVLQFVKHTVCIWAGCLELHH